MITPLGEKILIRPLMDKQSQDIFIPEQFGQSQTAQVVELGMKSNLPIKPGDVVLVHPTAAWTNVEIEGEELRIITPDYLLAIMETT